MKVEIALENAILDALRGGEILTAAEISRAVDAPHGAVAKSLASLQGARRVTSWEGRAGVLWASEDVPQYAPDRLNAVQPGEENETAAGDQAARRGRPAARSGPQRAALGTAAEGLE